MKEFLIEKWGRLGGAVGAQLGRRADELARQEYTILLCTYTRILIFLYSSIEYQILDKYTHGCASFV